MMQESEITIGLFPVPFSTDPDAELKRAFICADCGQPVLVANETECGNCGVHYRTIVQQTTPGTDVVGGDA